MDKQFHKTFSQCPNCGSDQRFCEQLAKEMKERGLARLEWRYSYDVREGVVIDPTKQAQIPIGSVIPGFHIALDICMDCGALYAIELIRLDAKVSVMPPPPPRGKLPNIFNDPRFS